VKPVVQHVSNLDMVAVRKVVGGGGQPSLVLNLGVGKNVVFSKTPNFLKHWKENFCFYVRSVWYLLMCVLIYHGYLYLGLQKLQYL
jgi:hypothetical protein